jgi:hypothetical protein
VANLEKLITRDTDRSMRSLSQDMNISRTTWERWCPRMDQIAENLHYFFQHGRHPCQQQQEDAGLAQEELTEACKKKIWPPSSPSSNPVDYFVWGVYDLRVRENPDHKTKDLIS